MKTEIYSWRLSAEAKADLEREARFRKVPVSTILDAAVRDWLKKSGEFGTEEEAQRRLHAAAAPCGRGRRLAGRHIDPDDAALPGLQQFGLFAAGEGSRSRADQGGRDRHQCSCPTSRNLLVLEVTRSFKQSGLGLTSDSPHWVRPGAGTNDRNQ